MDISIVIVNYKNNELTFACLDSIAAADFGSLRHEVIVVDNASGDDVGAEIARRYPFAIFIQNPKNTGMGAGNNMGIARARGRYVVVMNPDTVAFPETFSRLYDFMESQPDIGIAGPQQLNPGDRTVQDSAYRWHSLLTPLYRRTFMGRWPAGYRAVERFLMRDYDKKQVRDVDWLLGSCLFIRASALQEVGLFDERFFLYFEDTDLCRRFWNKGWRVVYYPQAQIIHNHARASAKLPWYLFFSSPASRHHLFSWFTYLFKWGLRRPRAHS